MSNRVLVVDDSVSMRQMTGLLLKGAGFDPVEAGDGQEALEKLTEDTVLVITDFNMPRMNGVELIRAIRGGNVAKTIPILMITTESEDDKKQQGRDAGATAWIVKPFTKDQLLGTLRRLVSTVSF
jgi:two-component system, chemotaxis family, chemotaxis protein CheY